MLQGEGIGGKISERNEVEFKLPAEFIDVGRETQVPCPFIIVVGVRIISPHVPCGKVPAKRNAIIKIDPGKYTSGRVDESKTCVCVQIAEIICSTEPDTKIISLGMDGSNSGEQ